MPVERASGCEIKSKAIEIENMTRSAKLLFMFLLVCISVVTSAHPLLAQTEEAKRSKTRESIGLDLSVPDFDTKRIDANVMGVRLAGIIDYLMENYQQSVYERRLTSIVREQSNALENIFFQIKKTHFVHAFKKGNEITILMRTDLLKNAANRKQTDIIFQFKDGLSDNDKVNELFSYISHYVQAREQIQK